MFSMVFATECLHLCYSHVSVWLIAVSTFRASVSTQFLCLWCRLCSDSLFSSCISLCVIYAFVHLVFIRGILFFYCTSLPLYLVIFVYVVFNDQQR
jgi:hypothetical protein